MNEVALCRSSTGIESGGKLTLMPTPKMTYSTLLASQEASARMPANFFPSTNISLGHLMVGACGINEAAASATATAAIKVIWAACSEESFGRKIAEKYKLAIGGDSQRRPSRPRP